MVRGHLWLSFVPTGCLLPTSIPDIVYMYYSFHLLACPHKLMETGTQKHRLGSTYLDKGVESHRLLKIVI